MPSVALAPERGGAAKEIEPPSTGSPALIGVTATWSAVGNAVPTFVVWLLPALAVAAGWMVTTTCAVAAPQGAYRVYDFLSGADEIRAVGRDGLGVELKGRSCALVYFGLDSPAWQAFLAKVKQTPRPE